MALGCNTGTAAATGSYNVFLGTDVTGTAGDTNTMRLDGTGQNRTFIAGIYGTTVAGSAQPVVIDANGQLGTRVGTVLLPGDVQPVSSELLLQIETHRQQWIVQQQVTRAQQQQLADQQAMIAELRARVEALLVPARGRKQPHDRRGPGRCLRRIPRR